MKFNISKWWVGLSSFVWGLYLAMFIEALVGKLTWNVWDSVILLMFTLICAGMLVVSLEKEEETEE